MRALLDTLYRLAGALAAVGMIATLVMVASGIFARPFGIYLPGTDDYAGYAMAACGFLALAYTFKHGEHIRVSLVIERLGPRLRRLTEWFAHAAGLVVAAALAWYAVELAWQSHEFDEISQGIDATPLWIPQLAMAIGAVILLIAVVDDFIQVSLGREPQRLAKADAEEMAHME